MNDHNRITNLQVFALVFTFVFSTQIAFLLNPLAAQVSTDGVWCILAGGVAGTVLTIAAIRYPIKHTSTSLGVQGSSFFGRAIHSVILLIVAFFFLHLTAIILREFTDFFVVTYLRETPPIAVTALVMLVAVTLTQAGVTAVFRFAQGMFLFIGVFFLAKPLFTDTDLSTPLRYEFLRLHDWQAVWKYTYFILPWYGELILLAFIAPQFASPRRVHRAVWIGSLAGTYLLLAEYVFVLLTFGPKLTATLIYPSLELAGFVHIGDFINNMDPIIVSIWFTAFFIKIAVLFAVGTYVSSQALRLREYKPIIPPLAALVTLMSIYQSRNPSDLTEFIGSSWSTYALFIELLPFLYPLAAWMKSKHGGPSS